MKKVGRFSVFDELETSCKMAQKEIFFLAHSFLIQKLTDCAEENVANWLPRQFPNF